MGIFDRLKDAIFGHPAAQQASMGAAPGSQARGSQPGAGTSAPSAQTGTATATASASTGARPGVVGGAATPAQPVDIEAVLERMAAQHSEKLNWRSSIVDLMKLVGLDPSLANRRQLASELGYHGDAQDSAAMNVWLHKEVMQKLAQSGGTVPASLRQH